MAEKLFKQKRFSFIGSLVASKEPMTDNKLSDTSEWKKQRLNVGVKVDGNAQFLNMEFIHSDRVSKCKILDKDGELMEVSLNETHKPEIINKASDLTKIVIDLETDFEKKKEYTKLLFKVRNHEKDNRDLLSKKELTDDEKAKIEENNSKIEEYQKQINELATNRVVFCHMKDAIKFLNASIPTIGTSKIKITGNIKSNFYNGKNNIQYIPNNIELVPEETESQLKAYIDVFYDKDSIEDDKKLKKMFINGYIGEREKKKDKLYPLTVLIDYTKIDEEDDDQKALLDFMKNTFKITDKKQVHKIGVEINVINGSEIVEFDESCLTKEQKTAVALGLKKVEDFKPRGNVYGNRIQELRVCCPDLSNYPEGAVEVFSVKDLGDYLADDDSDITEDKAKKETNKSEEKTQETSQADKLKALFG